MSTNHHNQSLINSFTASCEKAWKEHGKAISAYDLVIQIGKDHPTIAKEYPSDVFRFAETWMKRLKKERRESSIARSLMLPIAERIGRRMRNNNMRFCIMQGEEALAVI